MRIDLGNKRHNEIKCAVLNVLEQYSNVKLPIPIKKIVKFLGYRLVPYSTFSQKHNLTYEETVNYFKTDDACSEYERNTNIYVIYFNDMDKSKIENNRVRWNIAHELGHIVLKHHKNDNTCLLKNTISLKEYNRLEEEADWFASYILVPYIVLIFQRIKTPNDITRICRISKTAAKYRFKDFSLWVTRINSKTSKYTVEDYDKKILNLYNISNINQDKIFCLKCGNLTGYNNVKYCCICGNKKITYQKEMGKVIYKGIELDENKRAKECPKCHNEEFSEEDFYCKICGFILYNECTNYSELPFENSCTKGYRLDGNARYCPFCGNQTSFFKNGFLLNWDNVLNIPDEELPF